MTTQRQNPAYRPAPTRRVFALADTHLGGAREKGMERFGPAWWRHREKLLKRIWQTVREDDLLLLPGDLSWATKRRDAQTDLAFLAALPGVKIAVKGNHDFWWESDRPIGYPGLLCPPQVFGAIGIAGSRGWQATDDPVDQRFIERERRRLAKSLEAIADFPTKIAMLHYPPHPFLDILTAAGVSLCVYGHIHRDSLPGDEVLALDGEELSGIACHCVACDRIDFTPKRVL